MINDDRETQQLIFILHVTLYKKIMPDNKNTNRIPGLSLLVCPWCKTPYCFTTETNYEYIFEANCANQDCLEKCYHCVLCPRDQTWPKIYGNGHYWPNSHHKSKGHERHLPDNNIGTFNETNFPSDNISDEDIDNKFIPSEDELEEKSNETQVHGYSDDNNSNNGKSPMSMNYQSLIDSFNDYQKMLKRPSVEEVVETYNHHKQYYQAQIESKGANYLVDYAIRKGNGIPCVNQRSNHEILFQLLLAKITMKMSRNDCASLLSLFQYATANTNVFLPSCTATLRSTLLEGKYSLYKNLPYPLPFHVSKSYSMISITELIQYMFSTNHPPLPFLFSKDSIHIQTERGKELFSNVRELSTESNLLVFPIKVILWSDAFQPTLFSTKSVHCLLATIGSKEGNHTPSNTFPVWLGLAKESTYDVEMRVVKELNCLSSGLRTDGSPFVVYHQKLQRLVRVQTCVYSYLCDRPDKGKRTGTMTGGSHNLIYGSTGNFGQIMHKIGLCRYTCYPELLKCEKTSNTLCSRNCSMGCLKFDLTKMKYDAPEEYPENALNSDKNKIPVKRISFSSLKKACHIAFEKISHNMWNKKQMVCYLRIEGVCTSIAENIYINASNQSKFLKTLSTNALTSNIINTEVAADKEQNPMSYAMPPLPPIWDLSSFDIHDFPCAIAHHLFLGILKAISSNLLHRFLVSKYTCPDFVAQLEKKLEVLKSYNLPYLSINDRTGSCSKFLTFPGWLCRNWVSFARTCKWTISHLSNSLIEKNQCKHYDYPSIPSKFTRNQIVSWCESRNIETKNIPLNKTQAQEWYIRLRNNYSLLYQDYSETDIICMIEDHYPDEFNRFIVLRDENELRTAFIEFVTKNEIVPPVLEPITRKEMEGKEIEELFTLFHCVVSRIMGDDGHDHNAIDRYIKLFLAKVHHVDCDLTESEENRSHILSKKLNFLTMLNIPNDIKRFGHFRLQWELSGIGEGYIPLLKRHIHNTKNGFASCALNSVFKEIVHSHLLTSVVEEIKGDKQKCEHDKFTTGIVNAAKSLCRQKSISNHQCKSNIDSDGHQFYFFRSLHDCSIANGKHDSLVVPVLCTKKHNNIFIVERKKRNERTVLHMLERGKLPVLAFQSFYFQYSVTENSEGLNMTSITTKDVTCGLLLQHSFRKQYYYLVQMDWREVTAPNQESREFTSGYPIPISQIEARYS